MIFSFDRNTAPRRGCSFSQSYKGRSRVLGVALGFSDQETPLEYIREMFAAWGNTGSSQSPLKCSQHPLLKITHVSFCPCLAELHDSYWLLLECPPTLRKAAVCFVVGFCFRGSCIPCVAMPLLNSWSSCFGPLSTGMSNDTKSSSVEFLKCYMRKRKMVPIENGQTSDFPYLLRYKIDVHWYERAWGKEMKTVFLWNLAKNRKSRGGGPGMLERGRVCGCKGTVFSLLAF